MPKSKMWIGGEWVGAESGKTFPVYNAATGEEIARVPLASKADVDKAVTAARQAFTIWSNKTQGERSEALFKIADAIAARSNELAEVDAISHGLSLKGALRWGMLMAQDIKYTAQVNQAFMGQVVPGPADKMGYLQREPRGVAALFVSWNAAYGSTAKKLPAALATGNTCIIKAPSASSLTMLKLAEVLDTLDLPPGTVNVITGPGGSTGEALVSHPGVNLVSFTGGTANGKRIMSLASNTLKHLVLELGGKNPYIVLEDADLDLAVSKGVMAQIDNAGQACIAPGRFYVHKKIYDEFVEKFVAGMKKIVVGDLNDEKVQMGPLFSAGQREKVEAYINTGIKEGAKLVLGGKRPTNPPLDRGYFVMPTVFTDVTQDMTIAREEIFGPVAVIMKPCSSDDEAVSLANDNSFGLCAYLWTKNTVKGIKFANQIQAGTVNLNCTGGPGLNLPSGGFKDSGFGKEKSILGLEEYVQTKAVLMDLT